jgi:hypothetical protein
MTAHLFREYGIVFHFIDNVQDLFIAIYLLCQVIKMIKTDNLFY